MTRKENTFKIKALTKHSVSKSFERVLSRGFLPVRESRRVLRNPAIGAIP
jgi:hypothetical protein